jgi:hypothetical protein
MATMRSHLAAIAAAHRVTGIELDLSTIPTRQAMPDQRRMPVP